MGVECCFIGAAVLEKPQISRNSAAAPPPPDSRKIVCWPCGDGFSFLCTFQPHERMSRRLHCGWWLNDALVGDELLVFLLIGGFALFCAGMYSK